MFIKHSKKIVCIDSTHEMNQYEFALVTLVVADEFNKDYPVRFFISNHAGELSLRPFLEEIKKRCTEDLKINTVMTDDDNSGWNAFTNVFGSVEHHLLCKWHITRTWRRKLSKLAPKTEVTNELYRALLVLLEGKDPLQFEILINGFLSMCNEKSPNFGEYFEVNYKDRAKQWAMCYRNCEHANTDTNMCVESFHNVLKTYYMERKPNKRVDDLINVLLSYEEDNYWRHKPEKICATKHQSANNNSRHTRGMSISDEDLTVVNETTSKVKSQSKGKNINIFDCFGSILLLLLLLSLLSLSLLLLLLSILLLCW